MRHLIAVLVAVVALTKTCAFNDKETAINQDLGKLKGKWKIVRQEFSGTASKDVANAPDEFVGNKWVRPNRRTGEYELKLDPTKDPKHVDLSANRLGAQVLKGIYKIDGDNLTICYAYDPALPRPTEFKTKTSDKCYLYVLERVKNK